jgi:signal transduction histidine kinase
MTSPLHAAVAEYLERRPPSFDVAMGPVAASRARALLQPLLPATARLHTGAGAALPHVEGPVIWVLAPEDLRGPDRAELLERVWSADPARPVLYGGTRSRETLLDAINTWRVLQVVPDEPAEPRLLVDAVKKAHELVRLEAGLERAEEELRKDTERLEQTLGALERAQARLLETERLATLGHITRELVPVLTAHLQALQEFNTLIGHGLHGRDPRMEELLTLAFGGIKSLQVLLEEVGSYVSSRPEVYRLEPEDVDAVVRFAVSFSRFDPLARERVLETALQSEARARCDSFRMYQVLINLLRNAFQATPRRGRVSVRTGVEGHWVTIEVENDGDPIPPEIQEQMWKPFFSTKGQDGMGLGLSMARSVVERHGGALTCTSAPGRRTCFRIRLPLVR